MNCGLLGRKLSHSYSPQIHALLGEYPYSLVEKEPEEVATFLNSGGFTGLNVTTPYKKTVLPLCDALSDIAKVTGSVNTIVRRGDGTIIGHNTDYFGFSSMVRHSGLDVTNKKVLVLGSGGASNTAVRVLVEMGANVVVISRTGENNYRNLDRHTDCAVIVNATPIGMYPNNGISPVDLDLFPSLEGVLDLIYNPAKTKLLMDAERRRLITQNGLWMLVAQAKESAEWFTEKTISDEVIATIYRKLFRQMQNIILIGMPGCGKSTVAKHLGQLLSRPVADADDEIEKAAGCTIPEIFARDGEAEFRRLEASVLAQLGKASGWIIATGGGCVTCPENYTSLHQNGTIIWLQRDIHALPSNGRPLSQTGELDAMYRQRQPLYAKFADIIADNNGDPIETAEEIRRQL